MKFLLLPFTTVISDFTNFTWSNFVKKGYPLHALVAYLLCDLLKIFIPYPLIYFSIVIILGVAYEIYRLAVEKTKPDYQDVRWMAYICIIHYLINLFT